MIIIICIVVGFLLGFFVSSVYFQFIIEDVIHEFTFGEFEYEKQKQDKK